MADALPAPGGLPQHEARAAVLRELHARPFAPLVVPRRIYLTAFLTTEAEAKADRAEIARLAVRHGAPAPPAEAKLCRLDLGAWHLRWEQHTEFTTYTWSTGEDASVPFSHPDPIAAGEIGFTPPGPLIGAVHVSIVRADDTAPDRAAMFSPTSLCAIAATGGMAHVLTDFQVDVAGFTRILIEDRGMSPTRAGRLAQRILEMETYRTLTLLGLPTARAAGSALTRLEQELLVITQAIGASHDAAASEALLKRLTRVSGDLQAQTAQTAFRFGATRAYQALVQSRLQLAQEQKLGESTTISAFFAGRLAPAVETCNAVETRQQRLSLQAARAADLLRTGIQLELEQQNRGLLQSMDQRAQLQLRLQQTVEGLSVAAISYYVIGLLGYVAKGIKETGLLPHEATPELITALAVPVVVLLVWLGMRRLHHSLLAGHDGGHGHG